LAQFALGLPEARLSVIRWRRTEDGPKQFFEREPVEGYVLSILLEPMRADAWLDERPIWSGPIGANTIRLTLPKARPRWASDSSFDVLHLIFPREAVDQIAGAEGKQMHSRLRQSAPLYRRDDVAANLGRMLLEALRNDRPLATTFADALARALIAHVLGRYASAASANRQHELCADELQCLRDYIAANLHRAILVRDLASALGMSESHFARRFRASTGLSPHQFITTSRLDHARVRLRTSSVSVLQVALDCGFKDAGHFSRVFKKFVGHTPQVFRREISRSALAQRRSE
jgi:AraC family transcriptional regulator